MNLKSLLFPFIFCFSLLLPAFPAHASGEDVSSQIALANDLYAKGQYQEAANTYQKLIDDGQNNGYLFYNLGNTYLRLGNFGLSILNYIRAKNFLPRDQSLDANLRAAIMKTEDQLEPPSTSGLSAFFFWVNNFTQTELLVFVVFVNLTFWLILGVWFVHRTKFWDTARKITMAFLLISVFSVGAKIALATETTAGVILANKMDVKSARGTDSMTLFQLHEGSVVAIIERQNDWYQIKLNDGKKGWVKKDFIGF